MCEGAKKMAKKKSEYRRRRKLRTQIAKSADPESLGAVLGRIDERLYDLGYTDRHASTLTGMSADLIRSIRKQFRMGIQHNISRPTIAKLAEALETTPIWLARREGPKDASEHTEARVAAGQHADLIEKDAPTVTFSTRRRVRSPPATVRHTAEAATLKVTDKVAAGAWFETDAHHNGVHFDITVPADPRLPAEQQAAVIVDDNSADIFAARGDILVIDTKRDPKPNDLVVVSRTRANLRAVSARRYRPSDDHVELSCESNDPRHQGSVTFSKKNMKAEDGSMVKVEGVVIYVYRPVV